MVPKDFLFVADQQNVEDAADQERTKVAAEDPKSQGYQFVWRVGQQGRVRPT